MKNTPTKYISEDGSKVVKISWVEEWEEFHVKLWIDKKFQMGVTYFTDNLEDAVDTAKAMVAD